MNHHKGWGEDRIIRPSVVDSTPHIPDVPGQVKGLHAAEIGDANA